VCFSAAVGLAMSDLTRSAVFAAQHLRLALKAGEPQRIARALALEMGTAPAGGEEGIRWANRALPVAQALSERQGDAYHRGLFYLARGHVAYFDGQWAAAVGWLDRAEALLREPQTTEVQWALLSGNVIQAIAACLSGDLPGVADKLPLFIKDARQRGDLHSVALMAYPGVFLELAFDRVAAARRLAQDAAVTASPSGFHLRDFIALHCSLLIDRYTGDAPAGWARLDERWNAIRRSNLLFADVVRVTALAERGSAALAAAERIGRERLRYARAFAEMIWARLAWSKGKRAAAIAHLTEAASCLDAAGMALHADSTRRCLGFVMGGERGRALIDHADAALARQGVQHPARFAAMMAPGFDGCQGWLD
jgi:hypothetical protein